MQFIHTEKEQLLLIIQFYYSVNTVFKAIEGQEKLNLQKDQRLSDTRILIRMYLSFTCVFLLCCEQNHKFCL